MAAQTSEEVIAVIQEKDDYGLDWSLTGGGGERRSILDIF